MKQVKFDLPAPTHIPPVMTLTLFDIEDRVRTFDNVVSYGIHDRVLVINTDDNMSYVFNMDGINSYEVDITNAVKNAQ